MDWLAERYVILWSKALFFVENPTSCDWIDFLQAAFVLLSTGWLLRTAYAVLRSRTITKASWTLEDHPDTDASEKLRDAFRNAQAALTTGSTHSIDTTRLRIRPGPGALLCNAGILRPKILVSAGLIRKLGVEELTAALAHEIAHVVRRDNLKRVGLELAWLLIPLLIWMHDGLRLAVSPRAEFLAALFAGIAAWLVVRKVMLPAIHYWQERRADEWAAGRSWAIV